MTEIRTTSERLAALAGAGLIAERPETDATPALPPSPTLVPDLPAVELTVREQLLVTRLHRLRHLARYSLGKTPIVIPAGATSELDLLEDRTLRAVKRDEVGGTARDGYPGGQAGAGGEDAPRSSTEGAALALYRTERDAPVETAEGWWGKAERDKHHDLTRAAEDAVERINTQLDRLVDTLTAIDTLADPGRHSNPPASCGACGRRVMNVPGDLIKKGWCADCRNDWPAYVIDCVRNGHTPDRAQFARARKPAS